MSELSIRVRRLQDNGSTFRATPDTLYLGGMRSAKVDTLRFELPEEWTGCAVTLHVQRLSGTLPDPQILDENNCVVVDRRWTLEKQGMWMLMAVSEDGYVAMTKPAQYTCYETIDTDSTTETIDPSVYEQFVNLVVKSRNEAVSSAEQAKASEEAAAGSAEAAKTSENHAAASEKAAAESAQKAAASESNAATSEQNAKASETAAKQSEENAKASETASASSAGAAAQSQSAAAQAQADAEAARDAAKESEESTGNILKDTKQAGTDAVKSIGRAESAALDDIDAARTGALQYVANATEASAANAAAASQKAAEAAASADNAAASAAASANSAAESESSAENAAASKQAAANSAAEAEESAQKSADAAMKALQEAAASGAFKGDTGAQGPQGPSGTIIRAYDITLATSGWKATSDSNAKSAGMAYQCDASVSGCTSALEPSATISLASVSVAQKAGLGSICQSESGYCRFYAAKVPSAAISLRLLLMERTPT